MKWKWEIESWITSTFVKYADDNINLLNLNNKVR